MTYVMNRTIVGDGSLPLITIGEVPINGLSYPFSNGTTDNRIAGVIGAQFENYRVQGFKYHVQWCYTDTGTQITTPTMLTVIPTWSDSGLPTLFDPTDLGQIEQVPYARYTLSKNWQTGANWAHTKGYIPIEKFRGSRGAKYDNDYLGYVVDATGQFTNPAISATAKFRLYRQDRGATPFPASGRLNVIIRSTYYVEWNNVSMVGIE